ncbi:MAG TPA: YicC family protein [Candidatus Gallacutalibacter stercoravium]|nr:YicC family protein [Candidatus Gallacutalibacter stercoravium]
MVNSMTGYGRAEATVGGHSITVEMKSVNHRYFELSSRLPRGYGFLDDRLRGYMQGKLSRGKVDLYISIETLEDSGVQVQVNHPLASGYVAALQELGRLYQLRDDLSISTVARYSDIFSVHRVPEDEDAIWESVRQVTDAALEGLLAMRQREGARLCEDVEGRARTILDLVQQIEQRSPQTVEEYKIKLQQRLREMTADLQLDEQRLITEAAIFADKVAVDEETVRLRSHFKQMEWMLQANEPVGRKLDFLVQEMNREINTIGSKAQDAQIAHIVVEVKAELEKIREQIQNIE